MKGQRGGRVVSWTLLAAIAVAATAASAQTPAPEAAAPGAEAPPTPAPRAVAPAPPAPPAPRAPGAPRSPRTPWPARAPVAWVDGGYLGVEAVDVTPELREHYGAPREAGVLVGRVVEDSPAARAGLQVGDLIVELDGRIIHDGWELTSAVLDGEGDAPVEVEVVRDGKRRPLAVQLERRQRRSFDVGRWVHPRPGEPLPGFPQALAPALDDLREILDDPEFTDRMREVQEGIDREVEAHLRELEERLEALEEKLSRPPR